MSSKRSALLSRWVYPPEIDSFPETLESNSPSIIPELNRIGNQKYAEAYPISIHQHAQEYEFVYVQNGSVTWEVDGKLYPICAGEWFYTRPGELHKARYDYMEPSQIWWIILNDPENDTNWFRLSTVERDIIMSRLRQLPRSFRADPRTHEQLSRLKTTITSDSLDKMLFARYQLLDIILRILQPVSKKLMEPEFKEVIIRSVQQIVQSPELRYSVADMAKDVGVSESHYFKLFHDIYGQSPAAYLDRIRMERACQLLKSGISVTETSLELGFKTSQHFARVFKKIIGSSPSEWRRLE